MDIVAGNAFSAPLVTDANSNLRQTLTNGDNLTGQGTTPVLTAMLDASAGAITTITSTGVETFNLQNLAGALETIDGTITGLKNVAITQAAAGSPTTIAGLQSKLETLSLAQTNGSGFTATFANSALSGSADTITTTLKGSINGGVVSLGSTSGTNGYEIFNVKSEGSANTIASINDGANSSLASLIFSGNQSLTINNPDAVQAPTIDVTLTKIDAAGMAAATTGGTVPGVTIGGTNKAGVVRDFNTFAPTSSTKGSVSFVGGAGNDSLFLAGANVDDRLTINGGDGTDRVTIVGTQTAGATGASLTSVEELRLTAKNGTGAGAVTNGYGFGTAGATFNLVNATGVNTILFDGVSTTAATVGGINNGLVTINTLAQPSAGMTFNLVGDKATESQTFNGISYSPAGVTGTSSVAVKVGNQGQGIGGTNTMTLADLTMTGIPSVSLTGSDMAAGQTLIVTTGLASASLANFSATTGGDLAIGSNIGVAAVTSADFRGVAGKVTAVGGGTLTIGNAAGGAVSLAGSGNNDVTLTLAGSINASAGTGDQTLTGLAADGVTTITGGIGADTITGGAGADILSGGAGKDNITSGAGGSTITGGTGADTVTSGGADTIVVASGDSGIAAATFDTYTGITVADSFKLGVAGAAAGGGKNFSTGAGGGTFAASLTAGNLLLAANGATTSDRIYALTTNAAGDYLFVDYNKDGSADLALGLNTASGVVAGSIIA